MLTKQKLIELLEECIKLEADAVPLYTRHLQSPDLLENIPSEDQDRVTKALEALAGDSRSHQGIFETLLAKVKETPRDAF